MRLNLAFLALSLLPAFAAAQTPELKQLSRLAPDAVSGPSSSLQSLR